MTEIGGLGKEYSIDAQYLDAIAVFYIKGIIDGTFEWSDLQGKGAPTIWLDLKGIHAFNSSGIRTWCDEKRMRLSFGSANIELFHVPSPVLDAFIMIPRLADLFSIKSFFAARFCETCDEERDVLVTDYETYFNACSCPCKVCGSETVEDVLPGHYDIIFGTSSKKTA